MQQRVLQVHDVDELKQRLIDVWHHFEQSVIDVFAHEFVWNEDLLSILTPINANACVILLIVFAKVLLC